MAIHPHLPSPSPTPSRGSLTPQQTRAISAWTEQATASLEDLTLSEVVTVGDGTAAPTSTRRVMRGASSVTLTIPLDDHLPPAELSPTPRMRLANRTPAAAENEAPKVSVSFRRREPLRRDSLKRREALLKGKDGSRRRQRWENDRLLHNPWAEPPSSSDWAVQPTYTRHDPMPYYLASLWDAKYKERGCTVSKQTPKGTHDDQTRISKEVRMKLKHARAARGLLQDLEEEIRRFIQRWNEKQLILRDEEEEEEEEGEADEDSDEDEVVFAGRGQMQKQTPRPDRVSSSSRHDHEWEEGKKKVFESHVDDRAAGFARWLVHSLASYYGLHTWSVTVGTEEEGSPARREAYVGFHPPVTTGRQVVVTHPAVAVAVAVADGCRREARIRPGDELPTPLWTQV
ncbi:hypothetical protein ASPZODRAFT_132482 [Penicilliopsis zonata CBS 506.65]|uniref:R3H-associated N-terminal domain-containing protein n=1 Tax=Penicilliopsis zonata CBS 506.65 TaxID=1073090 RepID=A0A1L9SGX0_9EURO|nr:hypothetical protein ASPZODRAFT_132482 [Penicilliopsis zonata CBS 506.65]OJJ46388.1 hypothetical protein ASPZODRAFT_132482 [Penicilliopsis zonata CBS 506.65]